MALSPKGPIPDAKMYATCVFRERDRKIATETETEPDMRKEVERGAAFAPSALPGCLKECPRQWHPHASSTVPHHTSSPTAHRIAPFGPKMRDSCCNSQRRRGAGRDIFFPHAGAYLAATQRLCRCSPAAACACVVLYLFAKNLRLDHLLQLRLADVPLLLSPHQRPPLHNPDTEPPFCGEAGRREGGGRGGSEQRAKTRTNLRGNLCEGATGK